MRFLSNGLNIPDELLEARDQGNVVFLCGAGVSYPSGMPDFLELAKYVVEELGTPQDAPSRKMLSMWDNEDLPAAGRPSLDQIFNVLQQEYATDEIDYLIAKRLKTKPETSVSTHETILRLSKSVDGKPQIVTTNFDLLFERAAGRKLKTYVPPTLPDLANGQPLNGLVYLHGRINSRIKRGEGRQGFIVSSSDFGPGLLSRGLGDALHSRSPRSIHRYSTWIFRKRSARQILTSGSSHPATRESGEALRVRQWN